MAELFEVFVLPSHIEDCESEIHTCWQSKFEGDTEFRDVAAGPVRLIHQLADTVRTPQDVEEGPSPSWNEAVVDLVGDEQTIGVIGSQLRYLVSAIEETVFSRLPGEQMVEAALRIHRAAYFGLESAARAVANEIATVAYHSIVTGLPNKVAYQRDVERLASRATPCNVVYIDMDGLKIINDEQGHQAGDIALRALGERLSRELGQQDRAYHFSGDEFCIVTQETDNGYVQGLISRVDPFKAPRFSHGVARWPGESSLWEEVEGLAEARMRENKAERKARGEAPERPR